MSNQKQIQKKPNSTTHCLAPAQFQLEPFNPPLPAPRTLHYPLPMDRHIKPKLLNLHIEQSSQLLVFSDLGMGVEDMGWGGWKVYKYFTLINWQQTSQEQKLDEWDEALINEDINKLEQIEQAIIQEAIKAQEKQKEI